MFKNLKYLELTRHHMYKKTKKAIKDFTNNEDSEFHKLAEVVFSSALSLFLAYLTENYFVPYKTGHLKIMDIVILFLGGIVLYCLFYMCTKKIYAIMSKKIEDRRYNRQIHFPDVSTQKNKELIDDFDHIAFDNLIVACELLEEIKYTRDLEIRSFCFHEVIYYLKIAIRKTKEVTHPDRREQCLNIFGNVNGIDIFRLYNIWDIMKKIHYQINEILKNNDEENTVQIYDDKLKNVLYFQIKEIGDDIEEIARRCDDAKNDMKPRI